MLNSVRNLKIGATSVERVLHDNLQARKIWVISICTFAIFRLVGTVLILLAMFIPILLPFGVVSFYILGMLGEQIFGRWFAKKFIVADRYEDTLE
jgi:hypothetical protein